MQRTRRGPGGPSGAAGRLARRVAAAQERISAIYQLELPLRVERFLLSPEQARPHLARGGPRTGLLALEDSEGLWLGLYFDPRDAEDGAAILEETSHWLAVVWHALQQLSVSPLVLELQAEVDRYALARTSGREPLHHFGRARWRAGLAPAERRRYRTAHATAYRYCRRLERRFPRRADLPAWLAELRRFYRSGPDRKLHAWAAGP